MAYRGAITLLFPPGSENGIRCRAGSFLRTETEFELPPALGLGVLHPQLEGSDLGHQRVQCDGDDLTDRPFHGWQGERQAGELVQGARRVLDDGANSIAGAYLGAEEAELRCLARDQAELPVRQLQLRPLLGALRHDADAFDGRDIARHSRHRAFQAEIVRAGGSGANPDALARSLHGAVVGGAAGDCGVEPCALQLLESGTWLEPGLKQLDDA